MKKTPHLLVLMLLGGALSGMPAVAQQPPPILNVEPETQTLASGTDATLTATVTGTSEQVNDVNIDFEIDQGPNDNDGGSKLDAQNNWDLSCTTDTDGTCTVSYTGFGTGTDRIRAWIDTDKLNPNVIGERDDLEGQNEVTERGSTNEPDRTDVVTVTWQATGAAATLDTKPEISTNPPNGQQQLTATVVTGTGAPSPNQNVDFLIETGPGTGTQKECDTAADGTCSVVFGPPNATGSNRVRSWIDANGNELPEESDPAEMQTPDDPDDTDIVTLNWANEVIVLDLTPEQGVSAPAAGHTINAELKTNFNVPQADKRVAVLVRAGPNVGQVQSCTTNADGKCSVTFPGAEEGVDEYLGWFDQNENNTAETGEADPAEGRNEATVPGATAEPDRTDVVENTWSEVRVNVEPEQAAKTGGEEHVLVVTVTGSDDQPREGHNVDLEIISGPNADQNGNPGTADFDCTTGTAGTCEVRYTGINADGTDRIRGWLDANADNAVPGEADAAEGPVEATDPGGSPEPDATDVVEATWTGEQEPACEGTPQDDLLIGTETDDDCNGRGGNDTIATKGGNDNATGGGGNDRLNLGAGDDQGHGGPGGDVLRGGPGDDDLSGGGGRSDRTVGGPGSDDCRSERARGC